MMDCKVKGVDLVSMLERRVFNGCSTRFWTDSWLNDLGPLAIRYPRLFAREVQKDCFVAERWVVRSECWGPEWNWNQAPRGRGLGELEALNASLQGLKLDARKNDLWRWKLDKDGCFSVRGTYDFLCSKFYKSIYDGSFDGKRHEWNSMIPAKVNIFMWRALIDRLPFKNNLIGKGIEVNNASCLLCGFSDEWDQHVFFSCAKSEVVWRKVFS